MSSDHHAQAFDTIEDPPTVRHRDGLIEASTQGRLERARLHLVSRTPWRVLDHHRYHADQYNLQAGYSAIGVTLRRWRSPRARNLNEEHDASEVRNASRINRQAYGDVDPVRCGGG